MAGKRKSVVGNGVVGKIGKRDDAVTPDEATRIGALVDALNAAKDATQRAQIAQAMAELDYAQCERTLSKKYKLNAGDGIGADGTIMRKQG